MIFETHAHLLAEQFDQDRNEVIQRALENGILAVLNVSDDMKSSKKAVMLAQKHERVFGSVGVHPHNGADFRIKMSVYLRNLLPMRKYLQSVRSVWIITMTFATERYNGRFL